ncbi:MAG: hypothetical protein IID30_15380 [Planctomycetes bacterium]|nr:hypothetical protein [Planctomycetota bacterium]
MNSPSTQPSIRRKRWSVRRKTLLILIALAALWGGYEIVWRVTGEPAPVVDYFAKLNDLVASYQTDSGENGWESLMEVLVLFDEIEADAVDIKNSEDDLYTDTFFGPFRKNPYEPDRYAREVFVIEQMELRGVNTALQQVADMPVLKRTYAGGGLVIAISPITELSRFRGLAKARSASMRLASETNDFNKLVAGFEQCLALARASGSQATLIERLVGYAITGLTFGELSCILMERHLDEPTCRALLAAMDRQLNWPPPEITIEADRISTLDSIQNCFTDDGHGSGRIDPDNFSLLTGGNRVLEGISSIFQAGRKETTDKTHEIYDELVRLSRLTYRQRREAAGQLDMSIENLSFRHHFLKLLLPTPARWLDFNDGTLMQQRSKRLMLHLEIFFARHSRYPDSLDELVPDILPEMLLDPLTDGPFFYRRLVGEASGLPYVLYSAGRDGIDDHAGLEITDVEAAFVLHGYGPDGGDILLNQPREIRQEYEQ